MAESPPRDRFAIACAALGAVVWIACLLSGFQWLLNYELTPGAAGEAPALFPSSMRLTLDPRRDNLLVVIHPRCPCTRASVEQVERILARCPNRIALHALVYRPGHSAPCWEDTGLTRRLRALPRANVVIDLDGAEAARLGAVTSGQALLYSAHGRLQFQGGLTDGRGHAGDSVGSEAVVSLVLHQSATRRRTPVWGCPLAEIGGTP